MVQTWEQPRRRELSKFLLLRDCRRVQVGFDGLLRLLKEVAAAWKPAAMWIENEKLGQAACRSTHGDSER